MHSYTKNHDGTYTVGMWLCEEHEPNFDRLFDVASLYDAFRAVNCLNGGDILQPFKIVLEH